MKKVLFVANVSSHIKTFHEPYLKLWQEHGYKTYVACQNNLSDDEKINYCDVFINLPVKRSPYKFSNIKAIKQLKKIIDKEKFEVIHCHTPIGSVVARLAAKYTRKKYGTKVIYTAHGFHFYKGAPKMNWILFYPVEKYLAKYTDTLITINKEDYVLAKKRFSKKCHDIRYVPGVGIDLKKFELKMNEEDIFNYKKNLGLRKNDFVLTCVARLDKNKNQLFLINVMERLVDKNLNFHLLLVGPDELDGYYQKIVEKKMLNNNIHFLGKRDDILNVLSITDIVVSASLREGLPVNIIESLAVGKPVVALNCRGMSDLIANNKNGFIISRDDNNNMDLFINSLIKIKNGSLLRRNIYVNDLKKIEIFKIESILKEYERIVLKK